MLGSVAAMSAAERWLAIPGWEGLYEVSDLGRVRSLDRLVSCCHGSTRMQYGRTLRPYLAEGYPMVELHRSLPVLVRLRVHVHALALFAFVGPRPDGMECLHEFGDRTDSRLQHLSWGTRLENAQDRIRHGTQVAGELHPAAKLTDTIVRSLRARHAAGESSLAMARELGVSRTTAERAANGTTWRHL